MEYTFKTDKWTKLQRYATIGTLEGSYYANRETLTNQNLASVRECIEQDGRRVVNEVVAISDAGRAPKNDFAIRVLALAISYGDEATRQYAARNLPKVCRTATHLFQFAEFAQAERGWGKLLRRAVRDWYEQMPEEKLAYQLCKYQNRNGWTHKDLFRLSHPKFGKSGTKFEIGHWLMKGWEGVGNDPHPVKGLDYIWAAEKAKRATSPAQIIELIKNHGLVRECVPTQWMTNKDVLTALLAEMPMTAMLRNLASMTKNGVLDPMSESAKQVCATLKDKKSIVKSRIHPMNVLIALNTYKAGRSTKGESTWTPNPKICSALEDAFYLAFGNVPTTGKRIMQCLDVSGSMGWAPVANLSMTSRDISAAMSLITMRTEENCYAYAFCNQLTPLTINEKDTIYSAVSKVSNLAFGSTDCSLPMEYALAKRMPVDAFIVYTDNECNTGRQRPVDALRVYREKMGINAKMIVCAMTATNVSIADPNDSGMLDIVGFDSATPAIISEFIA